MYNLSAGGGAMILRKNLGKNIVEGTHIMADGSLARTAGVEIGGTKNPVTHDNLSEAYKSLRLMQPKKMKDRLKEVSVPNWYHCIDRSLEKSGKTRSDIDYLAILHIKRSAHNGMMKDLRLKKDQTVYLEDYGHMGQIDQILSLHLGLEEGKIKDGTTVSLIAAGIGYIWGASVIQWGAYRG
jgi:3-oxoacyl-[acyl-carrier-protein] synthase-3